MAEAKRRRPGAAPARRMAFSVLRRWESRPGGREARPGGRETRETRPDGKDTRPDGWAPPRPDDLVAQVEKQAGAPPGERDRALLRELVFGVLRWRRLLDHVLESHTRGGLRRLDPAVRTALRLGLYQLRFLDRVPHRAAVHESVSLAASARGRGAAGLVNAVLRAYLRSDHPWPHRGGDARLYLRVGLSHPDWLGDRTMAQLGRSGAIRRLEANNQRPATYLFVTRGGDVEAVRAGLAAEGVTTDRFPLAPRCLRVAAGNPQRTSLHREGRIHLQDAGSQLIPWLMPVAGARRVLDACAAPGGKAAILAERLEPRRLLAGDIRSRRLGLLLRSEEQRGSGGLLPFVADAARPPFPEGSMDRVLLDVPCSGLGTLARNPDIKWTSSPARIVRLAEQARRIAGGPGRPRAPGGFALYWGCSLEPEETTGVVAGLKEEFPDLRQVEAKGRLPPALQDLADGDGALRLRPERHGTDGYFAALLRRTR